jgi:hypothetical protein
MKLTLNRYVNFNLGWIVVCLLIIIFGDAFPIEFSSAKMRSIFFIALCLGLPISIIWTCYQIFHFKSKAFGVGATMISLPIITIALLGRTMCATTDEILYANRNNSSNIVAKSFGCGAWDSDFPKYSYYRQSSILGIFYLNVKVDTSRLDKTIWIKQ